MTTHNFKMLIYPVMLETSATVLLYKENTNGIQIHNIITHNTSESLSGKVQIYLVPNVSGNIGTAGLENEIASLSIEPEDAIFLTFPGSEALVLNDINDSIQAKANNNDQITFCIKGDEIA